MCSSISLLLLVVVVLSLLLLLWNYCNNNSNTICVVIKNIMCLLFILVLFAFLGSPFAECRGKVKILWNMRLTNEIPLENAADNPLEEALCGM